jgi:hypothetical protein
MHPGASTDPPRNGLGALTPGPPNNNFPPICTSSPIQNSNFCLRALYVCVCVPPCCRAGVVFARK